ncbi:MAG: ComEA family DNA-binding protein [Chloroflexi bacterium]|nr:ComEA family DNA-binding protein [Chloroflexota bacterium]
MSTSPSSQICDFSGTNEPVIKGNISGSGKIYHTPTSPNYNQTKIDESAGERWFCTVAEAESAGWRAPSSPGSSATATPALTAKININTATKAELISLPEIGETKAQAIIDYRQANGPFSTVDELLEVKGIGPATLEAVRDLVEV